MFRLSESSSVAINSASFVRIRQAKREKSFEDVTVWIDLKPAVEGINVFLLGDKKRKPIR